MRIVLISGNPKSTGLCRALTDSLLGGARDGGAEVTEIDVNGLARCRVCGDGWGTCLKDNKCAFGEDGFNDAQAVVRAADAVILVTPVYWAEESEALKAFLDKLRRCEKAFGPEPEKKALFGKPVLLAASAGGSGRGTLTCLEQMERFCTHTGANVFDQISVNRWNGDYKLQAAYAAAKAMAGGRKVGDTVDLK
jgi:multimeric flavodoxin WrbA